MAPVYASREALRAALDAADSPRAAGQYDRLLDAASRDVEALCRRRFYPERSTKTFDWPSPDQGTSYRLWLDDNELLDVDTLTSGGREIDEYFLEPQRYGPPYDRVEVDLDGGGYFGGTTVQRGIEIVGTWGACNDTEPAGALAGSLTSSATTLTLTSGELVGVLDTLLIGAEYVQVTGRAHVDTGQTLTAALLERTSDTAVTVTSTAGFAVGEQIRVDGERMVIVDLASTVLYVQRARDASPLAAHDIGAAVYASRRYTVRRAQLGTTAAAHADAAAVARHRPPSMVESLTIAEAIWAGQNEQSGMARVIGEGDNARQVTATSIADERKRVRAAHGRSMRLRAI